MGTKREMKKGNREPTKAPPAENDAEDPAQPNRFNAVIEKIERLYMGKHSSDEEDLDDVPDDDQYDTDDSFIDDAELDEYFEVDNLTTKHTGFFVNKGTLEQMAQHVATVASKDELIIIKALAGTTQTTDERTGEPGTSANVAPKKRRSKDQSADHIENNQGATGDYLKPGKASGLKKVATGNGEYYHEGSRVVKTKPSATGVLKRRSTDFAAGVDSTKRTKISSKDVSYSSSKELKDLEKYKAPAFQPTDFGNKSTTSETHGYASACRDKDPSTQLDFQQKQTYNGENEDPTSKIYRKDIAGTNDFSSMDVSGAAYPTQAMHLTTGRESAGTKPKGTRLERAIRDLQKIAANYKSPAIDISEADPNVQASAQRRLPPEVKQKLAKVARLSTNHGKVQENELMDRLMGIVGHLVVRRTLKRNMKELVKSGLSAKQEKADRLQQVKMEINEMVKASMAAKAKVNEQQDGSADDFQTVTDERRDLKGKSAMNSALEDRICDLYDLYVEGMDEDKGPQSRKLYVELAELWPQGYMDKFGIKDAISRSKERKGTLHNQQKVLNEERLKRKRLAAAAKLPDSYPVVTQSTAAMQVAHPSMSNPVTTYPVTDYGQNQVPKSLERVRETSSSAIADESSKNAGDMKKKKRKSDPDVVDTQANIVTMPTVLGLPFYDQQPS
uniref:Hpc2-related domain-containing protein n=1 Tax=Aegilops tauschii TaxID=37682 RepID=N1R0P1_AEGTA